MIAALLVGLACHFGAAGALPDRTCTPGALNPLVTQATVSGTICRAGWAASVRPPQAVTEPGKFRSMRDYGVPTTAGHAGLYEFDHLIPIELGGATDDPRNLWPEAHDLMGDVGSFAKDRVENRLRVLVCSGVVTLARARRIMRVDWRAGKGL